jgi:phage terminase large subunit
MVTAPAENRLHYRLYPVQDDFVHDQRRYPAFIGGRNSGKTYSGSIKALLRATGGGLGCIAAPSFPQLEGGAKRQFIDRLNETGMMFNPTRTGIHIPTWNAEVIFVTLESESRVRGPNYEWAWPDELEYVVDRKIWKALLGAVRAGDNPQVFPTTTPKGRRIIYDEWVAKPTHHHSLYTATTFDNVFIDAADYVSALGYEDQFYEQEIMAGFVSFEGLVYPGFNELTNVRTVDVTGWQPILGLDLGTTNPTVILTAYYAGDRLHIASELYERGMSSDRITDEAVRVWDDVNPSHIVVDPSAAGLIQSLEERGIVVVRANNDVKVGIITVLSRLPNLTVDPSCVHTIAEFGAYQYRQSGSAQSDTPVKANDHAMDVIRYLCMDLAAPVAAFTPLPSATLTMLQELYDG